MKKGSRYGTEGLNHRPLRMTVYIIVLSLFGFLVMPLTSCSDDRMDANSNQLGQQETVLMKTVEHDGCEYVKRVDYNRGFMAHKGNCKNPIHDCSHVVVYKNMPIDSAEIAIGYLKSNGALKEID
jgi:hypothetical protein